MTRDGNQKRGCIVEVWEEGWKLASGASEKFLVISRVASRIHDCAFSLNLFEVSFELSTERMNCSA